MLTRLHADTRSTSPPRHTSGSDLKNANNVVLDFSTCGLSLPSREYYTEDNFKEKRDLYAAHHPALSRMDGTTALCTLRAARYLACRLLRCVPCVQLVHAQTTALRTLRAARCLACSWFTRGCSPLSHIPCLPPFALSHARARRMVSCRVPPHCRLALVCRSCNTCTT